MRAAKAGPHGWCQRRFKSDPLCGRIAGINLTHPLAKPIIDSPTPWPWSRHDAGPPLILEPIALASYVHSSGVMEDPVERGGRQDGIASESLIPAAERQIGCQISDPFS
jgi:hypothetical protein